MNVLKKYIVPIALGIGLGLVLDLGYIQLVGKEALTFVNVMFLFLFIVCAYIIHIALHELGHLVFGLMSGFEFISYRFGSNMWIKQEGKIILKQMKVPGTAGQCLMLPPQSEKKPYVLYNLGGGLMNILVGLFCALFIPFSFHVVLTTFLFSMFAVGMFVGISNLVPMIIGGVATDGHNLMSVWKNPLLVDSLYKQLRATDDFIHGKSPLDYTDEYCTIPQRTDENEPLNTFILELKAERYLELNQFEKAKEIYLKLYENEKTMGVYRFTAQINLLILELFGERNEGMINKYYNDEMKKRVKANYTNISLILVELAIAKYIDHDEVAFAQSVQSLRQAYEKAPFPYEVEIAKKLLNQILSQE